MKRHYTYGEERSSSTRTACGLWLSLDACADEPAGVTCVSCSRVMGRDAPDLTARCVHREDIHAGLHDWHLAALEGAP